MTGEGTGSKVVLVTPNTIISITEALVFLGLTSEHEDAAVVRGMNLAIDKLVKNHCGRCFNQEVDTEEYLDGDGTSELWLKDYPIANVVLNIDSDQDGVFDEEDEDIEDYVEYPEKGLIYYRFNFPIGHRNIRATYDKGFADADMPEDLKLVCKMEVKNAYTRWKEDSRGLKSYILAGIHKTFEPGLSSWSKMVLDANYVKMRS